MSALEQVIRDLRAEGDELYALLEPLSEADWARPTPFKSWTVSDVVQHLHDSDKLAVLALKSPDEFRARLAQKAESSLEEFAGSSFKSWVVKKVKAVWRAPLIELINREIEQLEETVDGGLEHTEEVLDRLPNALDKRQEQIDHVLTTMLMGLVREVDVREIVLEQLSTVTTEQLEQGFREFSDDKLSFITLLGGLLGLVGGTVLVWPLYSIVVLAVLGFRSAIRKPESVDSGPSWLEGLRHATPRSGDRRGQTTG